MTSPVFVFYLSMLYNGCFWQCYLKKKKNYNVCSCKLLRLSGQRSKVRFTSADRAAAVSRRSMPILEAFRLRSHQSDVTRFPPEVSSTVTQKPKNQSPELMDVVEHRALFPLCLQPVVPLLLLRAWSLFTQALTCSVRFNSAVLINTHYTGLAFCSHKLLVGIEFSSTGNAACNHYSGLTVLYGSPQNP